MKILPTFCWVEFPIGRLEIIHRMQIVFGKFILRMIRTQHPYAFYIFHALVAEAPLYGM